MFSENTDPSNASKLRQKPRSIRCRSSSPEPQPMLRPRSNLRPRRKSSSSSMGHKGAPPDQLIQVEAYLGDRHPRDVLLLDNFTIPKTRHTVSFPSSEIRNWSDSRRFPR